MIKLKYLFFSLVSFILILIITLFTVNYVKADTIINVTGSAQVLNTPNYLYFTGYNANVKLNNDTHEFSGYAWSTDVGWVAFGFDAVDNPDGPVTFNPTSGAVSGKARIISTGAALDFNTAPYHSNVVIHSGGSFTGYAWSDDLGWLDFSGVTAPGVSISITITGTVYGTDETTPVASLPLVRIKVDGAGDYSANANGSGVYTISSVATVAGNPLTIYLDTGGGITGATFTVATGSNMSNIDIYQDRATTRCDNSCSLTNANIDKWDKSDDSDIHAGVTTSNLTVDNDYKLLIAAHTFAPGGTVTNSTGGVNAYSGDLEIKATSTLNMVGNALSISGNYLNSGTATLSNLTSFTKVSGTQTLNSGGTGAGYDFTNLTKSGGGTLQLITSDLAISGTLIISGSTTVDLNGRGLTLATLDNSGTLSRTGGETLNISAMDTNSGEVLYYGAGAGPYNIKDFGVTDYYALTINPTNGTDTFQLGNDLQVNGTLTLSAGTLTTTVTNFALNIGDGSISTGSYSQTNGTFTANGSAITCFGGYSIVGGTYTAGGSTLTLDTTPQNIILTSNGYTLNNANFRNNSGSGSGSVGLGAGTLTFAGNFNLDAANTQTLTVTAIASSPAVNITGNLDFTGVGAGSESLLMGDGTWSVAGNVNFADGSITAAGSTLVMSGASKVLTPSPQALNNFTSSGTISSAGDFTVSGVFNISAGTFDGTTRTITLSGSGTPFVKTGALTYATSTVKYTGSSATNVAGTTYNNLYLDHNATTFTLAGDTAVNSILTINDGILDGSSRTITLAGSGTPLVVSGTFTPSTSTVKYTGTLATNVAATTYNNLTFDQFGTTFTAAGNLAVNSVLTISAGSFDAANRIITLAGSGTAFLLAGTFTPSSSTVKYTGVSPTNITATTYYNLTFDQVGTTFSAAGSFTVEGILNINAGNFNASNKVITLSGSGTPFAIVGTFIPGTSTIKYTGTTPTNVAGATYNNLTFDQAGTIFTAAGDMNVGSVLNINAGTFDGSNKIITLSGSAASLVVSGTFTPSASTIKYTGTLATNVAGTTYNNLTLDQAGTTFTAAGDMSVGSVLNINAGTFDASNRTITLAGSTIPFVISGVFTPSTSTIKYTGTLATNVAGTTYNNLTLDQAGTTFTAANDINVSSVLDINAGTFAGSDKTITLSGSGTPFVISGSFSGNTSTVKYTGSLATNVAGSSGYNNLTLDHGGTTFTLGGDIGVSAILTVNSGTLDGSTKTITLSGNGTPFVINSTFTPTASIVSYAGTGTTNVAGANYYNINLIQVGSTYVAAGDINVSGSLANNGIFDGSSRTITFSNAGTPFANSGSFTPSTSTVKYTGGAATNVAAVTYNNLIFDNVLTTFTADGDMTINSLLTISSGNFDALDKTITLAGSGPTMLIGGTFTPSTSTVKYTGTPTANITNTAYNNLTLDRAGTTFSAGGSFTVGGILNIHDGTFNALNQIITLSGSGIPFVVNGAFTPSTSTIKYTGGPAVSITGTTYNNLTLDQAGTTFTTGGDMSVGSVLNITTGTFNASTRTINLAGSGTPLVIGGAFTPATSTINYSGAAATNIANTNYYNLTFSGAGTYSPSAALVATGALNLSNGILDTTVGNFAVTIGEATTTNGSYSQTNGTFTANNSTITSFGNYSITGGTYNANTSTLILDATPQAIALTANTYNLNNVTFRNNSAVSSRTATLGTGTLNFTGNFYLDAANTQNITVTSVPNNPSVNISGNLDFTGVGAGSESLNLGNSTFDIDGGIINFTVGSITPGSSTLLLSGSALQTLTSASQSLYNLTIANPSAAGIAFVDGLTVTNNFSDTTANSNLTFDDGSTYAINNLELNGQAVGTRIDLRSSVPATQWLLNVSGTQTISFVDAMDSDASSGNQINAVNDCFNSGNNLNWIFAVASIVVSPASATLNPGGIQAFTAAAYDGGGNPIPGTIFTWSVINGGGTIDPASGLFTAGSTAGTYTGTVQSSASGVNGLASVIVTAVPIPPTPTPTPTTTTTTTPAPSSGVLDEEKISVPESVVVGNNAVFDASSLSGYVQYHWDFGDGNQADGIKVVHKYEEVDRYTVVVILKDESGHETKKSYTIDVLPPVPELTKIDTQKTNVILEGKSYRGTQVVIALHSDLWQTQVDSKNDNTFSSNFNFKDTKLTYGDHKIVIFAQKEIADGTLLESDSKDYDAYFNLNDNGDLEAEVKQLKREKLLMIMGLVLASLLITVIIILFLVKRLKNKK